MSATMHKGYENTCHINVPIEEKETATLVAKLTGHSHTEISHYNTVHIYKLSPTRFETTGLSHTAKERTTPAEDTYRVIQNKTCNLVLNK